MLDPWPSRPLLVPLTKFLLGLWQWQDRPRLGKVAYARLQPASLPQPRLLQHFSCPFQPRSAWWLALRTFYPPPKRPPRQLCSLLLHPSSFCERSLLFPCHYAQIGWPFKRKQIYIYIYIWRLENKKKKKRNKEREVRKPTRARSFFKLRNTLCFLIDRRSAMSFGNSKDCSTASAMYPTFPCWKFLIEASAGKGAPSKTRAAV